jgi:hypothetical protein
MKVAEQIEHNKNWLKGGAGRQCIHSVLESGWSTGYADAYDYRGHSSHWAQWKCALARYYPHSSEKVCCVDRDLCFDDNRYNPDRSSRAGCPANCPAFTPRRCDVPKIIKRVAKREKCRDNEYKQEAIYEALEKADTTVLRKKGR